MCSVLIRRKAQFDFVVPALGHKMRPASSSKPSPSQALWLWPSQASALALSGFCLSACPDPRPFPLTFSRNINHTVHHFRTIGRLLTRSHWSFWQLFVGRRFGTLSCVMKPCVPQRGPVSIWQRAPGGLVGPTRHGRTQLLGVSVSKLWQPRKSPVKPGMRSRVQWPWWSHWVMSCIGCCARWLGRRVSESERRCGRALQPYFGYVTDCGPS